MNRYTTSHALLAIASVLLVWGNVTAFCFAQDRASAATLRLDNSDAQSPAIYFGDTLIAQYIPESGNKPIIFPLQTISGHRVIRNYPLSDKFPFETKDHLHHRSLWFSYGNINGLDFWGEEAPDDKQGIIVGNNLKSSLKGKTIVLESDWEWQAPDRSPVAHSNQVFEFSAEQQVVQIDAAIRLTATVGDLKFGDTKEGAFAVRVGEYMKVEAEKGGHIVNDSGESDDGVWGKPARWVQYTGPAQLGDNPVSDAGSLATAGITMLVHPNSFSYPGRWHVRGYGLFAHNPFGVNDFKESQDVMDGEKSRRGGFVLKAGDEIYLHYLVLLHDGVLDKTRLEAIWKKFANR